jgi:hypothetical protein
VLSSFVVAAIFGGRWLDPRIRNAASPVSIAIYGDFLVCSWSSNKYELER